MSIARHHAEWLSLIEVSGPFLSMPVLLRVFPQGLDAHDPEHLRLLRLDYEVWEDNQGGLRPDPAIHRRWVRFVLAEALEFPEEVVAEGQAIPQALHTVVAEHGETLRPDLVIKNPDGVPDAGKPRILVQLPPYGQDLEKPLPDRRWKASPATRMMELLHGTGCRLGLVTNGERWMLVDAPRGETTGFASWYASLWLEEQITLRAFRSLLSARRFFAVPEDETLEALLSESASNQQEVTDQLGYQVRQAVEVLIQSLDRADQDRGRKLLASVGEARLYEAALAVMMRLVFLFSAEERGLLLLGDPLYDQHYAVSTLRAQLREAADQSGEEVLERRFDAWCRLLATFRAVHGGIQHDRLTLPAYGGHLFDPDRYPFLEGRPEETSWSNTPANPLPVDNRTVLHLLEALQILQVKVPGGGPAEARRLSFRALDIEQIGHVYEGLLDHTAKRAAEPILGLAGTKDKEPEIPLGELERLRQKGEDEPIEYLREETGRSASALKRALTTSVDGQEANRFRAACGNDDNLWGRVRPFASLVRNDTFGHPVVILPGCVYVTAGTDRRTSGTHYTPRSLTEPIVQHTLEPLVYLGPAEGKPKEQWQLRPAQELLDLKICDMATGSGAFLVQACRYLSELLVEAWEKAEAEHSGVPGITPEGAASTGSPGETLIPKDPDERMAYARRLIAQRCLHGVDKNPLAVEMAKLSLWLLTLAKDKPFTFLDHTIRYGDSLVGISNLKQLEVFDLSGREEGNRSPLQLLSFVQFLPKRIKEAVALRRKIGEMQVATVQDVEAQEDLLRQAEEEMAWLRCATDFLIALEFQVGSAREKERARTETAIKVAHHFNHSDVQTFQREAEAALGGWPTFHWPLEFPEVFVERGGFDAIVGNPPFMGGQKITGALGTEYRNYLVGRLANGQRGSADLCAYFFLRAHQLVREGGGSGMLATNTIAQGDTREVGLEQLIRDECIIPRAISSQKWPGSANLEVAVVWVHRGKWGGASVLDEKLVTGVTPFLTVPSAVTGNPYRLAANADKSFQGSIVLGMGFVLEPEEAKRLTEKDPRNRDVLFPYLNGEDLNSRPDQSPSRWVINFFDWPLRRGVKGSWAGADQRQRKAWLQVGIVPDDYPGQVAADYPDCLAIVEEKVKPERTRRKANGEYALRKPLPQKWWIYAEKRPALYTTIAGMERVLVGVLHTKFWSVGIYPTANVFSHALVVFALDSFASFTSLESFIHEVWAREYSGSLETRLRYTPSDCFETFPLPSCISLLDTVGRDYYEHRSQIMLERQEGLTQTYNRFHDPNETSEDIQKLRELHIEMDYAVATAYGWTDLDLGYGFHETKQGLRFMISDFIRKEVLARLLRLNHEHYAEEVFQGLHDK